MAGKSDRKEVVQAEPAWFLSFGRAEPAWFLSFGFAEPVQQPTEQGHRSSSSTEPASPGASPRRSSTAPQRPNQLRAPRSKPVPAPRFKFQRRRTCDGSESNLRPVSSSAPHHFPGWAEPTRAIHPAIWPMLLTSLGLAHLRPRRAPGWAEPIKLSFGRSPPPRPRRSSREGPGGPNRASSARAPSPRFLSGQARSAEGGGTLQQAEPRCRSTAPLLLLRCCRPWRIGPRGRCSLG